MGLFSSKKKTTVGTSVSRVITDKLLPNSVKSGAISGILQDTDIPMEILDSLVSNPGVTAGRMYRKAEKDYPWGLPGESQYSTLVGEEEARNILLGILGLNVNILYSFIHARNPIHYGWMSLVDDWGYDSSTNILHGKTVDEDTPVYLWDMQYVLGESQNNDLEPSVHDIYGIAANAGLVPVFRPYLFELAEFIAPTPSRIEKGSVPEFLEITTSQLIYGDGTGRPSIFETKTNKQETFEITIPPIPEDGDQDVLHVCYTLPNGKRGYWVYRLGEGTYPSLDALVDHVPEETGKHFPFTYFRFDKQPEDKDKQSESYKVSKRMMKILGLNYQDLIEAIDENPDIKDVEQAMMVFSVPANSEDPTELSYLYDYFTRAYGRQGRSSSSMNAWFAYGNRGMNNPRVMPVLNNTEIRDKRFRMALGNGGIIRRLVDMELGAVGTVTFHEGNHKVQRIYQTENAAPLPYEILLPTHVYRKQISKTMVEELSVVNLRLTYHIWGGHTVVAYDDEPILQVPIDMAIVKNYSLPVREKLYSRSLHFVFNSRVTQKVKWYQQSWFSTFLMIAAVVLVVATQGASITAWASAIAAGGAATTAALIALVKTIIKTVIISGLFKFAADKVGMEISLIIAALMLAYGAYDVFQAGGLDSAVYAGDLLNGANQLVSAAGGVMQDKLIDLQNELSEFGKYVEEQTKLLETAQESLMSSPILSPFILFGETPQAYYNRTIRSPNPGLAGVEAVKNFTANALALPNIDQTLQGISNGWVI